MCNEVVIIFYSMIIGRVIWLWDEEIRFELMVIFSWIIEYGMYRRGIISWGRGWWCGKWI